MIEALPYVMTAALRQRLDLLHHLLEFGRQLVLVAGPRGSGRTRLLETLVAEAASHWHVMQYNGIEVATPQRLLAAISSGLGVTGAAGEPALRRVRTGLAENRRAGRICALVIDDADALDENCLGLLYELALGDADGGELHVILAGEAGADLDERLAMLAPQPALLHLVELPPLDLPAARAMVAQLEQASGTTVSADDEQVEVLWQRVQGRPGALLAACAALLARPAGTANEGLPATPTMTSADLSPPRRNVALPRKYLLIALLCLIGTAAGALLHFASAQRRQAANTLELALPTPTAPLLADQDLVAQTAEPVVAEPVPVDAGPASSPRPAGAADADPSAYATVAADPGEADEGSAQPPVRTLPTPVSPLSDPATPPTPAGDALDTATRVPSVPAAAPDSPTDLVPPSARRGSERPVAPAPSAASSKASPDVPEDEAISPPVARPQSRIPEKPAALPGYTGEWVLTRPGQTYVVQLFATRSREAGTRFIVEHGLGARAAVAPIIHGGQPWYVVVYGHYPTRSAATAAIGQLPDALARLKPWPRLVQSLKGAGTTR